MRNFVYRTLFLIVGVSVAVDLFSWVLMQTGSKAGATGLSISWTWLVATPFTWFANPVPSVLGLLPFVSSQVARAAIRILMSILIARRLVIFIRTRSFSASPDNFSNAGFVLASIGVASLVVALALLVLAGLSGSAGLAVGWLSIVPFGVATFLLPLTVLINELWTLFRGKRPDISGHP